MKIKLFILLLFLFGCESKTLLDVPIDNNNITNIIEDLTSEEYKGRLTGTEENLEVSNYISDYFDNIGLRIPTELENYKQWYQQKSRLIYKEPVLAIVDDEGNLDKFNYVYDFLIQTSPNQRLSGEVTAELIVVNDIDSINQTMDDKIMLIKDNVFNELINSDSSDEFIEILTNSKLKGIILGIEISDRGYFGVLPYVIENGNYDKQDAPFLVNVNMDVFDKLLESNKVKISADFKVEEVTVPNVIGLIEGTTDEYIIIGAHFDHAGDNYGTYNPGALDNASGTAVMMEVSRIISEYGEKPEKNIVFIGFNGEEQLRFGSTYYVNNPIYPLNKTQMINIDSVGSIENVKLQIEGRNSTNTDIIKNFNSVANKLNIDYVNGKSDGSDHASFAYKGVEVVNLIHPGFNSGYHGPDDTIEKLDINKINDVVKLITNYLYEFAY